ncbi:MAG: hypothetical protein QXI02_07505 [Candidatus Caldarchaeum sp.]
MREMPEFLVSIATDRELLRHLLTPKIVIDSHGYSIIPVEIRCDHCESRIAINGEPRGYAVFDSERLWEIVCEGCRQRFFTRTPVYRTLREGLKGL